MKTLWLAVALIAIGWATWPYYAIYDLVTAVQNGDQEALERRADWQPLRQGLRDDFNSMFMRKMAADAQNKGNEPGGAFGAGLAALMGPAIIDRVVDAYVTPAGIAALIKNGRPTQPGEGGASTLIKNAKGSEATSIPTTAAKPAISQPVQQNFTMDRVKYAFFSHGPATFRVEVAPPEGSKTREKGALLFRWDGDWRLNRIYLPKDVME